MRHRLITLAYSHYNEKARWALDLAGIDYADERHMPPFSMLAVALASRFRGGKADKVSSRYSCPYLITGDGRHIADSSEIARWADAHASLDLYPTAEVAELEQRFHDHVGPHTRRIAYLHADADRRVLEDIAEQNVSPWQARAFKLGYPLFTRGIKRALAVDEASCARSAEILLREAAFVEQRLDDGRPFLTGDRFTAADLTFASLMAPALLVQKSEGYSSYLPPPERTPAKTRALTADWRARRAGHFVLRMFRDHRTRAA